MRTNRIQELCKNHQPAIGGWLTIPNSFSAEIMVHQGWDVLTMDMQHGLVDASALVPMLTAISVPSGFTDDGLPVGLQLVGRPQDDLGVL